MACDDGSIVKIDAMTTVESQVCKLDSPSWLLRTRRDTQQFVSINESGVMRLHDANGVVEAQHSMKAGVPTVLKQSEKTGHWFVGTTDGRIEWFDENLKPVDKIELRDEVTDLQIVIDGSVTRILAASRGRNIYEIRLASDHSLASTSRVRIDSRSRTSYSNLSVDTSRLYALNYDGELTIARRNDNQIRLTQQIGVRSAAWPLQRNYERLVQGRHRKKLLRQRNFQDLTEDEKKHLQLRFDFPAICRRRTSFLQKLPNDRLLAVGGSGTGFLFDDLTAEFRPLWTELSVNVGNNADICEDFGDDNRFWALNEVGDLLQIDTIADEIVTRVQDAHVGRKPAIHALSNHHLVTVGGDASIRIWDTQSTPPVEVRRFVHDRPLISLSVFEPHSLLATVDDRAQLQIWDMNSGRIAQSISLGNDSPRTGRTAFSPDGRYIAAFGSGQMLSVFDLENSLATVDMAGAVRLGGIGGMSLCWSPVAADRLIRASDYDTASLYVSGSVPTEVEPRISKLLSQYGDEVDLLPTHDANQIAGLTRDGELYFVSPFHFIRTSAFDVGMDNCVSMSISSLDHSVLVATAGGDLKLARFVPSFDQPIKPDGVDIRGTLHPLILASDGKRVAIECAPSLDSNGRGAIAVGLPIDTQGRIGSLGVLCRRNKQWRLDAIELSDPMAKNHVWLQGHDIAFDREDRTVVTMRQVSHGPGSSVFTGDLLLATELKSGQWATETVSTDHNAGHHPVLIQAHDKSIAAIVHMDCAHYQLVHSRRDPKSGQWTTENLTSIVGGNMQGSHASDGIMHSRSGPGRFPGDDGPTQYLQVDSEGEFSMEVLDGNTRVDVLANDEVTATSNRGEFSKRVGDDWVPIPSLPYNINGPRMRRTISPPARGPDGSLLVIEANSGLHLWRLNNNKWTCHRIVSDLPKSLSGMYFWIEEGNRVVVALLGRSSLPECTLHVVDAVLPKELQGH